MKKIEVTVTEEQSEKVEEVFRDLEILFAQSSIIIEGAKCCAYAALVPDQFVDIAIGELQKKIDLRLMRDTISIYNVEAHVSTYVDQLKEKAIKEAPPPNPFERLVEAS